MKSIDFLVILATMAQISGQYLNCGLQKAFIRVRFLDKLMPDVTLASAQTLRLAFLQMSHI